MKDTEHSDGKKYPQKPAYHLEPLFHHRGTSSRQPDVYRVIKVIKETMDSNQSPHPASFNEFMVEIQKLPQET